MPGKKQIGEELLELSKTITTESDLRSLAIRLGITSSSIDRHLYNERNDLREASYRVLQVGAN